MAKVFTIAPGLENLGALKTGGQGSVYKGRRIGEIITAIKLLPTPIHSENENDKSYRDFKNEVEKLKRVNRDPNPNVVKILSSGLSETGNFPFIEMDYIDGPDLEELLKAPHDPVFSIREAVKLATHLSNALAHCHKNDTKHGDIKSNNVKLNIDTGNYVLLDFGLAAMSDEDRRTSLRQAGAIEFMAPEQNEGQLLFQTDVYGFGIILFELLAGQVPFPLLDKGETARNAIRLSHMETPVPDMLKLRQEHLPSGWGNEKKSLEMRVPQWLVQVVYKCLQKKPADRFNSGVELHDFICHNSTHDTTNQLVNSEAGNVDMQVQQYRQQLAMKDKEINELRAALAKQGQQAVQSYGYQEERRGVSKTAFMVVLLIALGLGVFAAYSYFKGNSSQVVASNVDTSGANPTDIGMNAADTAMHPNVEQNIAAALKRQKHLDSLRAAQKKAATDTTTTTDPAGTDDNTNAGTTTTTDNTDDTNRPARYKVAVDRAYLYETPDESTKRKASLMQSDNVLVPVNDKNGFIYVVFMNQYGETTRGWLKKSDLVRVE